MQKRLRYFLLLGLLVTSTIVSSFSFADTAMAAPPSVFVYPEVKNDAQASALRTSMALCLTINGGRTMMTGHRSSQENIASGEWFNDNNSEPQTRAGYIVDTDNGQVQCRNLMSDRNVAGAFGWNSNIEMACALGLKRVNDSNCINGDGDFTNEDVSREDVYRAIDAKYNNATGGNGYNDAQYYLLAAETFRIACGARPVVTASEANADQKNSDLVQAKVVDAQGKVTDVYFETSNNDKHAFRNDTDDFDYITENCEWMADRMNEYAREYAQYVQANPPTDEEVNEGTEETGEGAGDVEEDTTSCRVDGIGWIVCPVMRFMSRVVDASYGIVSSFLETPTVDTSTQSPLYKAWSTMRDFANVAFVIAFLVIIYSQISSFGVSNYGIKKMLPRLIVAAILVNASYWICALAVDVSNILGYSLKDLFEGIGGQIYTDADLSQTGSGSALWDGLTVTAIAGAAAGAVLALYGTLSVLLPMLVLALFAIVTVILVLTLRQALIIILIVIAPLAFVAYLLPNTESLFTKWRKLFMTLLLMFPIIAMIFGGSALASKVITSSSDTFLVQVIGAGVTVIPLFITPVVMKTAGSLLGKFGAVVNNPNKGPFDRLRKKAEGYRDYRADINRGKRIGRAGKILGGDGGKLGGEYNRRRKLAAFVASAGAARAYDNEKKKGFDRAVANESAQEYFANRALSEKGFAEGIAGSDAKARSLKASAQSEVDKILHDDIRNREILLSADVEFKNDPQKALDQALANGDRVQANAAISMLMKTGSGGYGKIFDSIQAAEAAGQGNSKTMESVRDFIKENGRDIKAKDPAMIRWATQNRGAGAPTPKTLEDMAKDAGVFSKSDAEVAGFAPAAFKHAADSGAITKEQAKSILSNPNIVKDTSRENLEVLRGLAQGLKPDGSAAPSSAPAAPSPASAPGAAPTAQRATAPYSRADLQAMGPQNIQMVINSAGGAANLSDGDIAKIINATNGQAGADGIYNAMRAERDRRRGGTP